MKILLKASALVLPLMFMVDVDFSERISVQLFSVKEAQAIGRHGGSKRTARTSVAADPKASTASEVTDQKPATAVAANQPAPAPTKVSPVPIGTVVQALPADCKSVVVSGFNYTDCAGAYYRPAFQGNNLVYVVVQSPL